MECQEFFVFEHCASILNEVNEAWRKLRESLEDLSGMVGDRIISPEEIMQKKMNKKYLFELNQGEITHLVYEYYKALTEPEEEDESPVTKREPRKRP